MKAGEYQCTYCPPSLSLYLCLSEARRKPARLIFDHQPAPAGQAKRPIPRLCVSSRGAAIVRFARSLPCLAASWGDAFGIGNFGRARSLSRELPWSPALALRFHKFPLLALSTASFILPLSSWFAPSCPHAFLHRKGAFGHRNIAKKEPLRTAPASATRYWIQRAFSASLTAYILELRGVVVNLDGFATF